MKIIGILLLSVLGLILLLLVLFLFCPFTYDIKGTYREKQLTLHVRTGWLARLLQFGMDEGEDEHSIFLRIFGIRKNLKKEKNPDNAENFADTIEDAAKETVEETAENLTKEKEPLPTLTVLEYTDAQQEETTKRKTKKPQRGKIRHFLNRRKSGARRMHMTLDNFRKNWKLWRRFFMDETNRKAFLLLRDQISGLLKKILPRRMKLDLRFSTGSPDTTGQILGILAMFPMAYQNNWNVEPDFSAETFYVDAAFAIKGRIAAIQMVIPVVRIVLDKNCRKLYNRFKRIRTMNEKD